MCFIFCSIFSASTSSSTGMRYVDILLASVTLFCLKSRNYHASKFKKKEIMRVCINFKILSRYERALYMLHIIHSRVAIFHLLSLYDISYIYFISTTLLDTHHPILFYIIYICNSIILSILCISFLSTTMYYKKIPHKTHKYITLIII